MIRRIGTWSLRDWLVVGAGVISAVLIGAGLSAMYVQHQQIQALKQALVAEQQATEERGDKPVAPRPNDLLNDPRFRGARGEDGEDGKDGEDGEDGEAGPPGRDARDGKNGKDGVDGADGVDGTDGADGQDGAQGAKGDKGEPPYQYRYQDPHGRWHTCTRDEGSPDDRPTYTCIPDSGPLP